MYTTTYTNNNQEPKREFKTSVSVLEFPEKYDGTKENLGKVQGRETESDEKVIVSARKSDPEHGAGSYKITYSDGTEISLVKTQRVGFLSAGEDEADPYDKTEIIVVPFDANKNLFPTNEQTQE